MDKKRNAKQDKFKSQMGTFEAAYREGLADAFQILEEELLREAKDFNGEEAGKEELTTAVEDFNMAVEAKTELIDLVKDYELEDGPI